MYGPIDSSAPAAYELEVRRLYLELFPEGNPDFVPRAFRWIQECFGGLAGYHPIDTRYHDLAHTLQGTLCLAQLLAGRARAKASPPITRRIFELGVLAILFHDTGYLKNKDDAAGTGAKYTAVHVDRSASFAAQFLSVRGYSAPEITAVQNMIRCTGVNADLEAIPFHDQLEKITAFALATADLLGQMAAADYVEKLPILYEEFAEATRFDPANATHFGNYTSAEDLLRRTPEFWAHYVLPRIQTSFLGIHAFLNDPYPDGPNGYLLRIEQNLRQISGSSQS